MTSEPKSLYLAVSVLGEQIISKHILWETGLQLDYTILISMLE